MADVKKVLDGLRHCLPATKEDGILTCDTCPYYRCGDGFSLSAELVNDMRELLEAQRNEGHWIEKEDYCMDTYYDCSVCGESWTTIEGTPWQNGMNYCPHCGAKMEEENGRH